MFCVGCFFNLWMDELPLEVYLCCVSYVPRPMTHSWLPTLPLNIQTQCRSLPPSYLLVFQMWMVSGSVMLCCWACSSNKSKKYLTARGTGRLVLRMAVNKSSTNFCRVPWDRAEKATEINKPWNKEGMLSLKGHSTDYTHEAELRCMCHLTVM